MRVTPTHGPFTRLAIVNRGEAAMRAIHAVRELNDAREDPIRVIALYSETERHALFVRQADERYCLGPASAYLDYEALERALTETRADAAWVGWGFVAEHPAFAELCERLGIVFAGPDADVMRKLGDKIEAKKLAEQAGVPVAPWSGGPVDSVEDAQRIADELGFPLMIKAAAGGGGRGMRRVEKADEVANAYERARSEAGQAFGDDSVLMERLVESARHVEVQLMADGAGRRVGARRARLLLPAPPPEGRRGVGQPGPHATSRRASWRTSAAELAREVGYRGAATVEFLYEPESKQFSFMEVNARLQVEHPVTEVVTGADLVALQLHVAAGGRLEGDPPPSNGHAIEVRLNAEDPARGFSPAPGRISLLRLPTGPGIRVDTGFAEGDTVPADFDSMLAKIIAHGATREQAIARLRRAVADTMVVIDEGTTNQGFLLELLGRPELRAGEVDTGWLDRLQAQGDVEPVRHADAALVQAAIALCDEETAADRAHFYALARRGRPQAEADVGHTLDLLYRGVSYRFAVWETGPRRYRVEVDGAAIEAEVEQLTEHERRLSFGGRSYRTLTAVQDTDLLVEVNGVPHRVSRDEGGLVRAPRARRRGGDPGVGRRRGPGRRRRRRHREHEDGDLAHRAGPRPRARGAGRAATCTSPPAGRCSRSTRSTTRRRRRASALTFEPAEADTSELERLKWLVLGYDVTGVEVLDAPIDADGEHRLLELYADVRALGRPHHLGRRRRDAAQPAGVPARVPALARRRRRGAAGALRRRARARARPLRHRRAGAHAGAGGGLPPPVPLPAARRHRARRGARDPRPPARARRPRRRRAARRARPARERARLARAGAGRAGARAALALLRRAAGRGGPPGDLRGDGEPSRGAGARSRPRGPRGADGRARRRARSRSRR